MYDQSPWIYGGVQEARRHVTPNSQILCNNIVVTSARKEHIANVTLAIPSIIPWYGQGRRLDRSYACFMAFTIYFIFLYSSLFRLSVQLYPLVVDELRHIHTRHVSFPSPDSLVRSLITGAEWHLHAWSIISNHSSRCTRYVKDAPAAYRCCSL